MERRYSYAETAGDAPALQFPREYAAPLQGMRSACQIKTRQPMRLPYNYNSIRDIRCLPAVAGNSWLKKFRRKRLDVVRSNAAIRERL